MAKRIPQYIFDSSALLAVLQIEPGADMVADVADKACMSSVNVTEVITKLIDKGMSISDARRAFGLLHLDIEDFDAGQADMAAALRGPTKKYGLSLGDRACIALGFKLKLPVLTSDKNWSSLDLGLEIRQIR